MDAASRFRSIRDLGAVKVALVRTRAELSLKVLELERSRELLTRALEIIAELDLEIRADQVLGGELAGPSSTLRRAVRS